MRFFFFVLFCDKVVFSERDCTRNRAQSVIRHRGAVSFTSNNVCALVAVAAVMRHCPR